MLGVGQMDPPHPPAPSSQCWLKEGFPVGHGDSVRSLRAWGAGKAHLSAAAGKALLPFCRADYGSVFQGHLCSSLACSLPRMHSSATES